MPNQILGTVAQFGRSARHGLTYATRIALWRFPTHEDNLRFPVRVIEPSTHPSTLDRGPEIDLDGIAPDAPDTDRHGGFDALLAANRTTGFMVVRDGRVRYERYLAGRTEASALAAFSTAKAVVSALVGIAMGRGEIASVDDHVADYLPGRVPAGITIRHLLNMTSGFRLREGHTPWSTAAAAYYTAARRTSAARSARVGHPPGTVWAYNDFGPVHLAMVLTAVGGCDSFTDYSRRVLFDRIGMRVPGCWLLDSRSPEAQENAGGGLYLSLETLAKIGLVYLNGGKFEGRRVVPAQWVDESTSIDAAEADVLTNVRTHSFKPEGMAYKYGWWIPRDDGLSAQREFAAIGHYGQYIYVCPTTRTVVVRTGAHWGPLGRYAWLDLLRQVARINP
ncbi:serine hydrolase [Micromonospora sp. WMMD998]|uniref:serine hydrolase domain-containing protein n=1 Tax=Micromonospora sp. WMMD998 TaxID=3016092 RepID=UPI00249B3CBC|nr:serine hydrolase [Micromonospora sp. WMMD998]WFE38822.1 serine hydrolase [Micromonospora sp. WMMD998]